MPFIYPSANTLRGPKIGDGDCVALVRFHADVPQHAAWKQGEPVLDNPNMRMGMAIATFVNGRYPNLDKGNHAAFFLRHGAPGKKGFGLSTSGRTSPVSQAAILSPVLSRRADGRRIGTELGTGPATMLTRSQLSNRGKE